MSEGKRKIEGDVGFLSCTYAWWNQSLGWKTEEVV
jgi:hypothetical protein